MLAWGTAGLDPSLGGRPLRASRLSQHGAGSTSGLKSRGCRGWTGDSGSRQLRPLLRTSARLINLSAKREGPSLLQCHLFKMNQPDQTAGSHGHFEGWSFSTHPSLATPPPLPWGEAPGQAPLGCCSGRPCVVPPPLGLQTPHAPTLCRLQRSALELLTQPPSCVGPSPAWRSHNHLKPPSPAPSSALPPCSPLCSPPVAQARPGHSLPRLPPPEWSLSSDDPPS